MRRNSLFLTLCAATLLTVGCDRGATDPQAATLSRDDVDALADGFDSMGWSVLSGGFGSFGFGFSLSGVESGGLRASTVPTPVNVSFTRTAQCPKGGSTTIAATVTGQADPATHSLTTTTTATKTDNACAFQGKDAATITVTGDPNVVITSSVKVVNGVPSGPQTSTQKGGFKWTSSNGKSGACKVDLSSTMDFTARTRTVTGTLCGQTVNVTRTFSGGK